MPYRSRRSPPRSPRAVTPMAFVRAIVAAFGPEVLRPDGTLDRAKVGALVFADAARRRALEAIVHPAIQARRQAALDAVKTLQDTLAKSLVEEIETGDIRVSERGGLLDTLGVRDSKRLSDAQRDGDRVWALVRGSAVNQDGRSTGLTAPNVLAQQALLRTRLPELPPQFPNPTLTVHIKFEYQR